MRWFGIDRRTSFALNRVLPGFHQSSRAGELTGPANRRGRRWAAHAFGLALLSVSTLSAADIVVDHVNDSGAGSLRQGLAGAAAGDALQFQPVLNGTTLENVAPLKVGNAVSLLDQNSITVTDTHFFQLSAPLTVDWAGTLNLNGVLGNGVSTGSLVKTGTGTLVLSNVNTYAGGTTINGGTIQVLNANSLGSGVITVNNTLGNSTISLANGVNLVNSITLASKLIVNTAAGTTAELNGLISGTAATDILATSGNGTLILGGSNTFVGGVIVQDDSTLILKTNTALGTGTLTTSGALTLDLNDGRSISNAISLGKNLTVNTDYGTATLSGNITETAASQLIKTGDGTLILTGTNSYTGGTVISQGTLRGNSASLPGNITDNGTLVFNQANTGTYAGTITGTGDLIKTGSGLLIFSGTSMLPTTTAVTTGNLQVTGSLAGGVVVSSPAGALSGTGSVGSITNHGYVQPGTSSIGTLTVNGDFVQSSQATTEIKFDSAGNAPGVDNDLLKVNGHATAGGSLNVIATGGGVFSAGVPYTIVNASGGVSGQFLQASSNLSMFGVVVSYGANDITFELQQTTSLQAAGQTANEISIGHALDGLALTSSGPLFAMINAMGIQTPAEQRQSMDQLTGDVYANLETLGLQIGDRFQQGLTRMLVGNGMFLVGQNGDENLDSPARGQSVSHATDHGWVQGFGAGGNLGSDGNATGLNFNQGGALFGVDSGYDESGRLGVAGGTGYTTFNDATATGNVTSFQGGVYALKHDDLFYVLSTANYGFNQFLTNRAVAVTGLGQALHSEYTGSQFGASTEVGLKLMVGPVHIQPLIGLQYLGVCQQGVNESGGPAALSVNRARANSLRANVGARIAVAQWMGPWGAIWTPYTQARFVSDLLDNDRTISASFTTAPPGSSFLINGTRIGQNYGTIGEGAEIRFNESWSMFGSADVVFGDRLTMVTGNAALICRW